MRNTRNIINAMQHCDSIPVWTKFPISLLHVPDNDKNSMHISIDKVTGPKEYELRTEICACERISASQKLECLTYKKQRHVRLIEHSERSLLALGPSLNFQHSQANAANSCDSLAKLFLESPNLCKFDS